MQNRLPTAEISCIMGKEALWKGTKDDIFTVAPLRRGGAADFAAGPDPEREGAAKTGFSAAAGTGAAAEGNG